MNLVFFIFKESLFSMSHSLTFPSSSFTFDDSAKGDSAGTARPDFALIVETMDNEIFTRTAGDSTY